MPDRQAIEYSENLFAGKDSSWGGHFLIFCWRKLCGFSRLKQAPLVEQTAKALTRPPQRPTRSLANNAENSSLWSSVPLLYLYLQRHTFMFVVSHGARGRISTGFQLDLHSSILTLL